MSYAIVFSSKTGNTELLADTLHSCLPQAECCYFGNPNPAAMEADTLYVGFWTDKGKSDESTSDFLKQLRGKQVFLFGTAGFGGSEEYFNKILKAVQKDLHSSNMVIGSFMCQGKMPMSVRQRYENMKKQPLPSTGAAGWSFRLQNSQMRASRTRHCSSVMSFLGSKPFVVPFIRSYCVIIATASLAQSEMDALSG